MAGDEVGAVDQVRGADRLRAEAEMRHRDRSGLLGVVDEVALREQVGVLADDLHRALVGADGAVGAETEEHGLDLAGRPRMREVGVDREAEVGDVVVDADGEMTLRVLGRELVEHRLEHRWRHLLRREAVATADHPRHPLRTAARRCRWLRSARRAPTGTAARRPRPAPSCGRAPRSSAPTAAGPRSAPRSGTAGRGERAACRRARRLPPCRRRFPPTLRPPSP